MSAFSGCKLALFLGDRVLTIQRDDLDHIPYPGHWDFPGGGRDDGETPEACILRETAEETALQLQAGDIRRVAVYDRPIGACWFFAAHLGPERVSGVRLGDEGQRWALMTPEAYAAHPLRIPQFATWMTDYLAARDG